MVLCVKSEISALILLKLKVTLFLKRTIRKGIDLMTLN